MLNGRTRSIARLAGLYHLYDVIFYLLNYETRERPWLLAILRTLQKQVTRIYHAELAAGQLGFAKINMLSSSCKLILVRHIPRYQLVRMVVPSMPDKKCSTIEHPGDIRSPFRGSFLTSAFKNPR